MHIMLNSTRALRLVFLAGALQLGLCTATAQDAPDGELAIHGCGKSHALGQAWHLEQERAAEQQEYCELVALGFREAMGDTDVEKCDLNITILPGQTENIKGTITFTVKSQSAGLTQFTIRLRDQYIIDQALINGTTPVTVTKLTTSTRVVTLDRTYGMGETFTLAITYRGTAVDEGFGSIVFTKHAGVDVVMTLSEPYLAYTWWPCKDGDYRLPGDNSDKYVTEMTLNTPEGMLGASNGLLVASEMTDEGLIAHHWRTDYPLSTYHVFFSATNYRSWTKDYAKLGGGTMPHLYYIYPESDTTNNRAAWEKTVQMMTTLRDYYGEYPFVDEKYGIYQFPFGGGMEHQTFTGQGTFSENVTVHELGHSWWGNMITCKRWNDIWLNEGGASYTEALWAEKKPGSSGLPALKSYMNGFRYTGAGTVYVSDSECQSVNEIFNYNTTYAKAAWVYHMLRGVLGDTKFFAALAEYRRQFEYKAASTSDFQSVFESVYGQPLDWFFQEWVFGERTPTYAYGWSSVKVGGKDYLLLYIDQTQNVSYQRFKMPLQVRVNGTANYRVFNDTDPEHFVIPLSAAATTVQLDPDAWVLASYTTTSYLAGPPKIVVTSPLPGQVLPADPPTNTVKITFHTNVNTQATEYRLTGATHGDIPVTFSYDQPTYTTTLTAQAALPADVYTLTVSDALTAVNSGQKLDGEIANPRDPNALPSGDGVQGGAAVIEFTIGFKLGDMNCDGAINFADINPFVLALGGREGYEQQYPDCRWLNADCNGDGDVNFGDINAFVDILGG